MKQALARRKVRTLAAGLALGLAGSGAVAQVAARPTPLPPVIFVCEHGSAKSLIAKHNVRAIMRAVIRELISSIRSAPAGTGRNGIRAFSIASRRNRSTSAAAASTLVSQGPAGRSVSARSCR